MSQLDESIARGCDESRLRALWHATDVLISGQYSEQDIWTFGEIIERLARGIEAVARAELARRLAHSGNAPFNCIRQLARDASIEIAGPILRHSARLDVKPLIAIARSKSQPHLLAISKRETITEPVISSSKLSWTSLDRLETRQCPVYKGLSGPRKSAGGRGGFLIRAPCVPPDQRHRGGLVAEGANRHVHFSAGSTGKRAHRGIRHTLRRFRVTSNGVKSWSFRFRARGAASPGRVTLGSYPDIGLGKAREQAAAMRSAVAAGVDPAQHRREERGGARTFGALAERYMKEHAYRHKRPSSAAADHRNLNKHVGETGHMPRSDALT